MNHYANVNNTFRKSWKQQKPIQQVAPPRVSTAPGADRDRGGAGGGARGYSSFTESSDQVSGGSKFSHNTTLLTNLTVKVTVCSLQDGNSAVVSLNGTQLVMNNQARSRAPLPGFSSFV